MSHFTPHYHIGQPSTAQNAYIQCNQTPFRTHQPPLDHSHSLYQPRDSQHFGSTPLHTLLPNQPTILPAHASHYSFTFYRLINDKMRTSLTFLTLLAAAGSAVAAPVPASNMGNGAVQKIVSGHHRRSDSQVMVDLKEHMVSHL